MPWYTSPPVIIIGSVVCVVLITLFVALGTSSHGPDGPKWFFDSASNSCSQTGTGTNYPTKDKCLQGSGRWFCYNHKCGLASPNGLATTSYAKCLNDCSGWKCDYTTGVCTQTPNGLMGSECKSDCRVLNYQCINGKCHQAPYGGIPKAQCEASCGS